jgi:pimeloyl-ACP methyl ester carboxylesterase
MKRIFLFLFFISEVVSAQKGIDTVSIIDIGGIRQYITIKGNDRLNPVLLFLHGGPGGSVLNYADRFTSRLQDKFVVVQWDQRETGRTLEFNPSPVPLTFDLFCGDTHELMTYLLGTFNHKKIYVAGHSWGTALGFQMARQYPELLYAFIAIGPMINQLESERIILEKMKDRAQQANDALALQELGKVAIPFEDGEQLYYHRKWLFAFGGQKVNGRTFSPAVIKSWATRWLLTFNEASAVNLFEKLPAVQCPLYFIVGRKDYQTNSGLAHDYFNAVSAPKKQLFWIENTGHSIPYARPAELQEIIINKIYPESYQF